MKLTIKNETRWAVADLRPLIERALKEEQFDRDRITVRVYRTRSQIFGNYRRGLLGLGLPPLSGVHMMSSVRAAQMLCWLIRAERNMSPKDIPRWWNIPADWGKDFPVGLLESDSKPTRGLRARRYNAAMQNLERCQRRAALLDRAKARNEKLIKKWAGKVQYYEQTIAKRKADIKARIDRPFKEFDL